MDYKRQVQELNTYVKTYLAPSEIQGVGLFALRDIPKGQKLYVDIAPRTYSLPYKEFQNLFPEVRDLLLSQWPNIVNGSLFAYPTTRLQAYMNHSDDPNYDAQKDEVIRDIKADEEITEDYKKIKSYQQVYTWLK